MPDNQPVGHSAPTGNDRSKRLLLVDIDPDTVIEIEQVLSAAGFSIVGHAADTDQALSMAAELRPGATLVGHAQSGLLEAAAAMTRLRLAPMVILADDDRPELIQQARDAGGMGYVLSPFTAKRLLPAIEMAVARHTENIALRSQIADITSRLESRKTIERAKGLLMARLQMTEADAFGSLQRTALDNGTPMNVVAQAVIDRFAAGHRDKVPAHSRARIQG